MLLDNESIVYGLSQVAAMPGHYGLVHISTPPRLSLERMTLRAGQTLMSELHLDRQ